jgi:hypothetical protein
MKFPRSSKKSAIRNILALGITLAASLPPINQAYGQYLGVTCGYQYSNQLSGPPSNPSQYNISLYNPGNDSEYDPHNPTWGVWLEQLLQAGVDFVCPNLTGSYPNTLHPPSEMAPFVADVNARGLTNQLKFAIFDDNAASWCAQWNMANGRGYDYQEPFDVSDPANWVYIYDLNYKIFYQTVPDANRFKINGRPVIFIWSSGTDFVTNAQGNLSRALTYVRQKCQSDWGFNPYIITNADFLVHDTTCNNPGVVDATHEWFSPPSSYTLSTFAANGTKVGVAVAEFHHNGQTGFLNPDHGKLFEDGLKGTVGAGALVTLCEGFTDSEEDAAQYRVRNIDPSGNALSYNQTLYDYPNQRISILREHSRDPFPVTLRYEAEGCDSFAGAAAGNGQVNFYRNGNIAIETTTDTDGGYDVGWMQSGESFTWQHVPLNGTPIFGLRVASPNTGSTAHLVIDGVAKPSLTLPNTGGWQTFTTVYFGPYGTFSRSYHTVQIVFDNGGANFNWFETTQGQAPPVFSSGTFVNNSVLSLIGSASREVYGVSLGDATSHTTANGYTFAGYPNANISYGGPGAYGLGVFLAGGGTSGDRNFDAVLNNAELGISNGTLRLNNLTPGAAYKVLFLEADTRTGMGARSLDVLTAAGSDASPNQSYAFRGGKPSLGGYILCSFTAAGTTQTFTNIQSAYGYQLNGVLVGQK